MKRKISGLLVSLASMISLQSCCLPGTASVNSGFPQSVTETHTKTTLVAPPSYSTPYLPPAAIYQTAPVQAPMPMAAPMCPQAVYQAPQPIYRADPCAQPMQAQYCQPQAYASPVCQPQQVYQAPQYQADPCAPYGSNIRYNAVGTASPLQPQYIVVHPHHSSNPSPVQLQASHPNCDEAK